MADDSEVKVLISADFEQLKDAMDSASAAVQSGAGEMASAAEIVQDQWEGLKETLLGLGEAFLVFKAAEFGTEMVRSALELGESLRNLSVSTGLSSDHLQELQFAGAAAGVSMDRLNAVIGRLLTLQQELASGQGSASKIAALGTFGLNVSDLSDAYTVLSRVSEKFNEVGANVPALRAAFAELFGGRFALQLLPAIEGLSEFSAELKKMGLSLSGDAIAKLTQTQESFNVLGFAARQAGAALVAALAAPVLKPIADALTQITVEIKKFADSKEAISWGEQLKQKLIDLAETILTGFAPALQSIESTLKNIAAITQFLAHPLEGIATAFATLGGLFTETATEAQKVPPAIQAIIDRLEKMRTAGSTPQALKEITDQLKGIGTGSIPLGGGPLEEGGGPNTSEIFATAAARTAAARAELATKTSLYNEDLASFTKVQDQMLDAEKARVEGAVAIGAISGQQEIAALTDIENRRYAMEAAALDQKMALYKSDYDSYIAAENRKDDEIAKLYAKDAITYQKALDDKLIATSKHNADLAKLDAQASEDSKKAWVSALEPISTAFDQMFTGVIQGTQKIGVTLQKTLQSIALELAKSGIKDFLLGGQKGTLGGSIFGGGVAGFLSQTFGPRPAASGVGGIGSAPGAPGAVGGAGGLVGTLEKPITDLLSRVWVNLTKPLTDVFSEVWTNLTSPLTSIFGSIFSSVGSSLSGILGSSATAAAGGAATSAAANAASQIASNVTQATSAAGLAGANMLATVAAAPFPIDLTAPAEAAAAYANAMVYAGLASAQGGMDVGAYGTVAQLHAREMVLPSHLAEGVRDMVSRGGSSGDVHLHYSPQVSAIDHRGVADLLEKHGPVIAGIMKKQLRNSPGWQP